MVMLPIIIINNKLKGEEFLILGIFDKLRIILFSICISLAVRI